MSIIAVFIIIFSVVFDQLSKYWATEVLKNGESIKIIGNFCVSLMRKTEVLHSAYCRIKGYSFLIITIIMLIILGIVYFTNRNLSKLSRLSMAMIAGGAIGNFIDRYRMGYVIDFIDVRFGTFYNFPVFNIADSFVVCGTILMVILILFNKFETS